MDAGTAGVGARLQEIRAWRGLSLRAVAGLAGYSASYLSMIENGDRVVDKRSTLENLAAALQVSPADITGQPYPPANRSESQGHSAVPALRAVLRDIELGELATPGPPRSLVELRAAVAALNTACAACDYSVMGEVVPDLIGELHPLAEANGGEAWRLLAEVLHSAFYLSKTLATATWHGWCRGTCTALWKPPETRCGEAWAHSFAHTPWSGARPGCVA